MFRVWRIPYHSTNIRARQELHPLCIINTVLIITESIEHLPCARYYAKPFHNLFQLLLVLYHKVGIIYYLHFIYEDIET